RVVGALEGSAVGAVAVGAGGIADAQHRVAAAGAQVAGVRAADADVLAGGARKGWAFGPAALAVGCVEGVGVCILGARVGGGHEGGVTEGDGDVSDVVLEVQVRKSAG